MAMIIALNREVHRDLLARTGRAIIRAFPLIHSNKPEE